MSLIIPLLLIAFVIIIAGSSMRRRGGATAMPARARTAMLGLLVVVLVAGLFVLWRVQG